MILVVLLMLRTEKEVNYDGAQWIVAAVVQRLYDIPQQELCAPVSRTSCLLHITGSLMLPQSTTHVVNYINAAGLFNNDDVMLFVAGLCTPSMLANLRNLNFRCREMVRITERLQKQVMVEPPMLFLDVDKSLPQPKRDANIQALLYSPYLKGITTQKFLIYDNMAGWCNSSGAVIVSFLPTALDAFNDLQAVAFLKQMQYCYPAVKDLDVIVYNHTTEGHDISTKVCVSVETGVTLYDILRARERHTNDEMERGAPVGLIPVGAKCHGDSQHYTEGHHYTEWVYHKIRRCLYADAIGDVNHIYHWYQIEDVLKKWYERTCVKGGEWFAAAGDRAGQGRFLKERVTKAKEFEKMSLTERGDMDNATWVKHCLKWKCRKTTATKVFTKSKLLKKIASYLDADELPSIWGINKTTKRLFETNDKIRKLLFLEPTAGPSMVANVNTLSTEDKVQLKQTIAINPLCSKLIKTDLVSRIASGYLRVSFDTFADDGSSDDESEVSESSEDDSSEGDGSEYKARINALKVANGVGVYKAYTRSFTSMQPAHLRHTSQLGRFCQ
jgi:hypothetical protein